MLDLSRFREQFQAAAESDLVPVLRCAHHDQALTSHEEGVWLCPETGCPVAVRVAVEERPADTDPDQELDVDEET
jgi:hypothetical protein